MTAELLKIIGGEYNTIFLYSKSYLFYINNLLTIFIYNKNWR